jgi:predicted hydrocarbon binding protein
MEKLRATIEQFGRWKGLETYINRIEGFLDSDFSLCVENSKALLESIGKEICREKSVLLEETSSVNGVLKNAFRALGYNNDGLTTRISGSLASIGQEIGNLRNEIGTTSHGKTLDELQKRNEQVDSMTKEFLMDSTAIVAIFLIRAFEERKEFVKPIAPSPPEESSINYEDAENFNSFWDEIYGEFTMGDYSYTASEIFFKVDPKAYTTVYNDFKEAEADSGDEE